MAARNRSTPCESFVHAPLVALVASGDSIFLSGTVSYGIWPIPCLKIPIKRPKKFFC